MRQGDFILAVGLAHSSKLNFSTMGRMQMPSDGIQGKTSTRYFQSHQVPLFRRIEASKIVRGSVLSRVLCVTLVVFPRFS